MARRSYHRAKPGQAYAIEWPEWHVDCPGCGESILIAELGTASTVDEAERKMVASNLGWKRVKGLWRCPACKEANP